MANKYHISPTTGNPNLCRAEQRACPLGGDAPHYASKEEARAAFEAAHGGEGLRPLTKQDRLAALHQVRQTWEEYPTSPTLATLEQASAYARKHKKLVAAAYFSEDPAYSLKLEQDYDGTGSDWALIGVRRYLVAMPDGDFVHVTHRTSMDVQLDNGWEFYPMADGHATYLVNASAALSDFTDEQNSSAEQEYLELDESIFEEPRILTFHSSARGWSKWDEASVAETCRAGLRRFPNVYSTARVSRLRNSSHRFSKSSLIAQASSEDPRVRRAATARPELPGELHEKLVEDDDLRVRSVLASRSDLKQGTVKKLLEQKEGAYDQAPAPRLTVLRNPVVSSTTMARVARSGDLEDLRALAQNRALSAEARRIIEERTKGLGLRLF